MRLGFKGNLVIGTDITNIRRFLDPDKPDWRRLKRFARHFLLKDELVAIETRFPSFQLRLDNENERVPELSSHQCAQVSRAVAGRWAAKEAAKKAWGAHLIHWKALRVFHTTTFEPVIVCFTGDSQTSESDKITEQQGELTIAHDGDYATATVLANKLHADLIAEFVKIKREAKSRLQA
ncbi:uncharacterized protein HMPREF1541_01330, partial [Cyphellophora europaea CBS 101466]